MWNGCRCLGLIATVIPANVQVDGRRRNLENLMQKLICSCCFLFEMHLSRKHFRTSTLNSSFFIHSLFAYISLFLTVGGLAEASTMHANNYPYVSC